MTPGGTVIGLFGGTFDPVHHGHLRVALEACEGLGLEAVRLLPCHEPPHRGTPGAGAEARRAMLELAVAGEPRLVVDARELGRPGPSYTVDTLAGLRAEVGAGRPLALLVGADAFAGLPSWRRWEALFDLAHLVVLERPGHRPELARELRARVEGRRLAGPEGLRESAAGGVLFWQVTQLEISASAVREAVAGGRSARYLVPKTVNDYIARHGLYRDVPTNDTGA